MSDSWQPIIRNLMYALEYENDLPTRADRMFEVIAMAPDEGIAAPEAIRKAIDDALASSTDLATLYKQPYSDDDLRRMFADLSEKLQQALARSGDLAPQAGTWRPIADDDHAGVTLAAGEVLPEHAGKWWRLIRD